MGREPPVKTIVSMMLGFALAAVGIDTVTGTLRMTFGLPELLQGFDFLIAVIGLFGLGEILLTMEEGPLVQGQERQDRPRVVLQTWAMLPRYWMTSLRACLVGCWMGITPGGATPASFMSYGMARRFSKNRDKFGDGEIEGVIAPETAAHAAGTSALLPMLTLGIPGLADGRRAAGRPADLGPAAGAAAVRREEGVRLGPDRQHVPRQHRRPLIVLTTVPWWAAILRIPFSIIAPVIVVICAIGAYTVHNNMFDVVMMLVFGVVGYVFKKLKYPLAPLVLALVLGDMAETAFRQSMLLSGGSVGDLLVATASSGSIVTLALVILSWPLVGKLKAWLRAREDTAHVA